MMIISEPEPTEVMPTTMPPIMPIAIVRSGLRLDLVDASAAVLARAAIEDVAQHHRAGADQQRDAECQLDVALRRLRMAEQVQQVGADERHRNRAEHHPADQAQVDRALAQVHDRADRAHHHRRDQVARDRRRRRARRTAGSASASSTRRRPRRSCRRGSRSRRSPRRCTDRRASLSRTTVATACTAQRCRVVVGGEGALARSVRATAARVLASEAQLRRSTAAAGRCSGDRRRRSPRSAPRPSVASSALR